MKKLLLLVALLLSLSYQSKAQTVDTLYCIVYGIGGNSGYYINGTLEEDGSGCTYNGHPYSDPAIMVAVIDTATCQPRSNDHVDHGQLNQYFPELGITTCRPRPENYFIYPFNDTASFTHLHLWIRDSIPDGDYLLFYSWTTYSYSNSPLALDSLFSELSFSQWPEPDSVPFAFFCKKGNPSLNVEAHGVLPTDTVTLQTTFTCLAVGVPEIVQTNDVISIYPNPAHDNFTIALNQEMQNGELKIYDVMGRVVHKQDLTPNPSPLGEGSKVSLHCEPGIYFVRVSDGEKLSTQKLVVE